ncbi:MAG: PIN domain-containing protein [Caulobacteraceae bacterium]|nr:PIN domain-containing protein [Caulobacteraceae bacterium]
MILLDTNIISEALRPNGDPAVRAWLDDQAIETLYLFTITLGELRFGIAAMPIGQRRSALSRELDARVPPLFEGRLLPFDRAAADAYGALRAQARAAGRAIGTADGYIAGIAAARNLAVCTRDGGSFTAAGLRVIRP